MSGEQEDGPAGGRRRLRLISQVYVPDPAAVGQYMTEAAVAMADRGWDVDVLTANRGYDDPTIRFPACETDGGVMVRRLPMSSFGKRTLLHRLAGQLSFCGQAFIRTLFARRLDTLLVTTSPPMGAAIGVAVKLFRPKLRVVYWVMDINPDQAVALGIVPAGSWRVRLFEACNRWVLKRSDVVIALDRHMADTLARKTRCPPESIAVIPPWPLASVGAGANGAAFREAHGGGDRVIVMHSGNHSLAHPLNTVVEAARRLQNESRLLFCFVGGGKGKDAVDTIAREPGVTNLLSLPYQPLAAVPDLLAAADVHVVAMGDTMVGIVHPCKCYSAMAAARPLLVVGPSASHVAELVERYDCGWRVDHGDGDAADALLREIARMPVNELREKGRRALRAVEGPLSRGTLLEAFCGSIGSRPAAGE